MSEIRYPIEGGRTVEVYPDHCGWCWRVLAGNGHIAALGPQPYARRSVALRAARALHPEIAISS